MTDTDDQRPEDAEPTPKKRAPRKKPELAETEETTDNSVSTETETNTEPVAGDDPKPAEFVFPPSPYVSVVGGGDTDDVKLSAIKYKNKSQKKSLSVHHLQRRLNELGYSEAYADQDGYYGDLTAAAVARFQTDLGFAVTGRVDLGTIQSVFTNDPNVRLTLF